jgi:hypothetical protein
MTAVEYLGTYGVTPRLKPDGRLALQGAGSLPENVKAEVVTWARNNRGTILQELTPDEKNEFTKKETENKPTPPTAKTAKTPFYPFCSDRGSRFSEKQDPTPEAPPAPLKIMPMTACLDGKKCRHLNAPGDRRPICSKTGAPVFDMAACPLSKWAELQQTKR